jgi:hypothetical protein
MRRHTVKLIGGQVLQCSCIILFDTVIFIKLLKNKYKRAMLLCFYIKSRPQRGRCTGLYHNDA